jgi:hypothetical protein
MKINITKDKFHLEFKFFENILNYFNKNLLTFITIILSIISIFYFYFYLNNGLGLSYNDARSHLDIGRRVVEGLKPGIAQLGSVWLPLNHVLMIPLIWNDWAWHSGFAGAIWNMISFVGTSILIYKILEIFNVKTLGRIFGVLVFSANLNVLYLQSTAMTEPLLLATMTAGCYYLLLWSKDEKIINLVKSSFWIMMATLVRYDGWFLLGFATAVVAILTLVKRGYRVSEGLSVMFVTMGGFGIFLWVVWNLVIFGDPLYFILGPFSAHAQQLVMEEAGALPTKYNLLLSTQVYLYSVFYNSITTTAILGFLGGIILWFDKKIKPELRFASIALMSPLFFNIVSLFFGFSVIFIQGISGNTWFNVRYGVMLMPTFAIFAGYFINRFSNLKWVIIGLFLFVTFFAFANSDSVAIDDARVGSSQKNVSEVSGYLEKNTKDKKGFILISAASHDAIIFSSNLPMKKFIHEGTGKYWESATTTPDRWARWIVLRTYDKNDLTYKAVGDLTSFKTMYNLVDSYPFADIYELKEEYLNNLNTEASLGKQK